MKITASLVLYKTPISELKLVCQSLLQNSDLISEIFLIDNSPDDTLKNIIIHEKVKYLFVGRNLGYGTGHNIAIKKIIDGSDFHLALNADIYFSENVLPELINYLQKNSDVGLILPKVLSPNGEIQYLAKLIPTPFNLLIRLVLPQNFFKEKRAKYQLAFNGHSTITEAPSLSGCFMFFRVEAVKKVGLFDERFFLYAEDFDLSRRIHEKYKTIYYPKVEITHYHHRHSYKNFKMMAIHIISTIKYFNKWGWINDPIRRKTNKRILEQLNYKNIRSKY